MARFPDDRRTTGGHRPPVASASGNIPGQLMTGSSQARLICAGMSPVKLPWWPDELEWSGWAPEYAETARPGRSPLLSRSNDPLPSLRIAFQLRESSIDRSMEHLMNQVRELAAAKPVVQLMLGSTDRGVWRITDAGAVETDWAPNGEPSVVDVTMNLRSASDASVPIGPIKTKPKRKP